MRGADCDTDHCLVVAKYRKRLALSKQASQKFDMERFNLRKLNELEARKERVSVCTNWSSRNNGLMKNVDVF